MSLRKQQIRLKELGFYHGPITSEASKDLQRAIRAYRDSEIIDDQMERLLDRRLR